MAVAQQEVEITVERIGMEELLQQEPYEQFLQRHQAAGRVPVPMHVVTSRIRTKKQPEPVNADEGMASFVEYLEAAPASEYAKSQTKDRLEKTMQSQQIRFFRCSLETLIWLAGNAWLLSSRTVQFGMTELYRR